MTVTYSLAQGVLGPSRIEEKQILILVHNALCTRFVSSLTAQMIEVRQHSSNTAMNAAVKGLAEAVRTMRQSVSKPRPEDMRAGKPEPYALVKDFDDWDVTFNGYAGMLDPAHLALPKTARRSPTVVMATPPHEQ